MKNSIEDFLQVEEFVFNHSFLFENKRCSFSFIEFKCSDYFLFVVCKDSKGITN